MRSLPAMAHILPVPRDLSDAERNVLEYILAADVVGAKELRAQIPFAKVYALWDEGSPSVRFVLREGASKAPVTSRLFPAEAEVRDKDGTFIGGLMIWTADGYLSSLEYWWVTDDRPAALPGIDSLTLE